MDLNWIEVVDTAIKIGLGAIITAVVGYIMLDKTHKLELEKNEHDYKFELKRNEYEQAVKFREEKKQIYLEFLVQSQVLRQNYLHESCNFQDERYLSYLRIYNELQISSNDKVRMAAFNLFSAVNEFIILNQNHVGSDIEKLANKNLSDNLGVFQKLVQQELGLYEKGKSSNFGKTDNE